jgi:hypothetical protein
MTVATGSRVPVDLQLSRCLHNVFLRMRLRPFAFSSTEFPAALATDTPGHPARLVASHQWAVRIVRTLYLVWHLVRPAMRSAPERYREHAFLSIRYAQARSTSNVADEGNRDG